jgi:hypothetical protein
VPPGLARLRPLRAYANTLSLFTVRFPSRLLRRAIVSARPREPIPRCSPYRLAPAGGSLNGQDFAYLLSVNGLEECTILSEICQYVLRKRGLLDKRFDCVLPVWLRHERRFWDVCRQARRFFGGSRASYPLAFPFSIVRKRENLPAEMKHKCAEQDDSAPKQRCAVGDLPGDQKAQHACYEGCDETDKGRKKIAPAPENARQ